MNQISPVREVSLTAAAARRISTLVAAEGNPGLMLRLAVSGGGCSGFQYGFSFDDTRNEDDLVFERDGVKLLVDQTSIDLLGGAEIDFVEDLVGSSFQVRNPNASSSCGCGSSFSDLIRIASWNVNSVRSRIGLVLGWLREARPDVVLLQEIKCQTEGFPRLEFEDLGYNLAIVGQKSYNGVAILSRHPMTVEAERLPGFVEDEPARYVEGLVQAEGKVVRVASIYLPNGNPADSDKYPYKLAWLERLRGHAQGLLALEEPLVLGGDYNICPTDDDVYDPIGWKDDALCRPESRAAFRRLVNLGFTDAFRALHSEPRRYTFWDYQAGRWQKDQGLRIDHLLLSPQAADRLTAAEIDKTPRHKDKPSDHTPVWCELEL